MIKKAIIISDKETTKSETHSYVALQFLFSFLKYRFSFIILKNIYSVDKLTCQLFSIVMIYQTGKQIIKFNTNIIFV